MGPNPSPISVDNASAKSIKCKCESLFEDSEEGIKSAKSALDPNPLRQLHAARSSTAISRIGPFYADPL